MTSAHRYGGSGSRGTRGETDTDTDTGGNGGADGGSLGIGDVPAGQPGRAQVGGTGSPGEPGDRGTGGDGGSTAQDVARRVRDTARRTVDRIFGTARTPQAPELDFSGMHLAWAGEDEASKIAARAIDASERRGELRSKQVATAALLAPVPGAAAAVKGILDFANTRQHEALRAQAETDPFGAIAAVDPMNRQTAAPTPGEGGEGPGTTARPTTGADTLPGDTGDAGDSLVYDDPVDEYFAGRFGDAYTPRFGTRRPGTGSAASDRRVPADLEYITRVNRDIERSRRGTR